MQKACQQRTTPAVVTTINTGLKNCTIILSTPIVQDNEDNELYIFVGTSSNVVTQAAIISVAQASLTGSAIFMVDADKAIQLASNFPLEFCLVRIKQEKNNQELPDKQQEACPGCTPNLFGPLYATKSIR